MASNSYLKELIYTSDFPGRAIPVIYLADGKPGFSINQWIYWLVGGGITQKLLSARIQHVMHLYDFHLRTYRDKSPTKMQAQHLVKDFLEAKKYGSELMGWGPIHNRETLKGYLRSINAFDVWQAQWHGTERLNPSEEKFMSSWEINREWSNRVKWDPLIHLFPSQSHVKTTHTTNLGRFDHKRFQVGKKRLPKAFPYEKFAELVDKTPNPRDQMAWLLMGGGSLRKSEPLHLFVEDVRGIDAGGATRVRLDDPESGEWEWEQDGKLVSGTRLQYFDACYINERFKFTRPSLYQLQPRTKGIVDRDWAGWKGMTFHDQPKLEKTASGRLISPNEVFWFDPKVGVRFQQAHAVYMAKYFNEMPSGWPYHPWLFINVCGGVDHGLPWRLKSLDNAWESALKRIGMEGCGLTPHSLRHMFGSYCASVLGLPIETVMILMHHANSESTQKYYNIRSGTVKAAIARAIENNPSESIREYLITPDSKRLSLNQWGEV